MEDPASWKGVTDWLLAIATIILAVATAYLVKATYILGRIAKEESRVRKVEITVKAWRELRPLISHDNWKSENNLGQLETFAACVNSDVYDIEILNRISGKWYSRKFGEMKDHIENRRVKEISDKKVPSYDEILALTERICQLRSKSSRAAHSPDGIDSYAVPWYRR